MELLRDLKIKVLAPSEIRINEPVEIRITLDSTKLSKEKFEKRGYSLESLPINISLNVYSDLRVKLTRRLDWRIFEKGKELEKREDLAIVESKLKIPLGSTLTIPLKLSLPKAFPWIYINFPKSEGKSKNDIQEIEIKNGILINAEINGIDLSEYFDNVIEFSPTELYDEKNALDFLSMLIRNYLSYVELDEEAKKVHTKKELMDGTVLELSSDARFVALLDNLLSAMKLNKVNLFTHVFELKIKEFPSELPRMYSLEGRYIYRIEIIPKHGGDKLRSEITLSKLSMILILDESIEEARRRLRGKKADLFILLSPDKNSVSVKWELNAYKSRVMRFIKLMKNKYLFAGLPQPFIYDDIDFSIIGYYVFSINERRVIGGSAEIPFVLTMK